MRFQLEVVADLAYISITMAELTELFEFLSSPNPAARQIALQNLVGHTAKNDPQRHIFIPSSFAPLPGDNSGVKRKEGSDADDVKVKALNDLATLCRDQAQIAHDALSGLINLTDNLAVSRQLATEEFLVWLVSYTAVRPTCFIGLTSEHHFSSISFDVYAALKPHFSPVTRSYDCWSQGADRTSAYG